jgi:hypothetical protein
MGSITRRSYCPRLEALEDRAVPNTTSSAVQRPIADFVSQQGTTSVFNNKVPGK